MYSRFHFYGGFVKGGNRNKPKYISPEKPHFGRLKTKYSTRSPLRLDDVYKQYLLPRFGWYNFMRSAWIKIKVDPTATGFNTN